MLYILSGNGFKIIQLKATEHSETETSNTQYVIIVYLFMFMPFISRQEPNAQHFLYDALGVDCFYMF